jgi:hypothetical protein
MSPANEAYQDDLLSAIPQDASPSYLAAVGGRDKTLYFPQLQYDQRFFIRARPPTVEGDDAIAGAAIHATPPALAGNRAQRRAQARKGNGDATPASSQVTIAITPNAAFIAKCVWQVTDFSFPVMRGEDVVIRSHNTDRGGDNTDNREFYAMLAHPSVAEFRELVEQFLDYLGGRESDAQDDFEAFLAASPQLLTGMSTPASLTP